MRARARGLEFLFGAGEPYNIEVLRGQDLERRNIQKQLLRAFDFNPVDKKINKISAYSYLGILLLVTSLKKKDFWF